MLGFLRKLFDPRTTLPRLRSAPAQFWSTIPPGGEILSAARGWILTNGVWWGSSTLGHAVLLFAVLLLLGKVSTPQNEGEAPIFESKIDTEIPVPELDHFEVGETPLEPSELTTDTLSLVDAPSIEAADPSGASPDAVAAGGTAGAGTGGIGGLDQFAVKALGPGPLVRGSGLGAAGNGRGAGSGGSGSGFGARSDEAARRAMVGGYGGTKASERAVGAALNWLARHQVRDGSWSLGGFSKSCTDAPCGGPGTVNSDSAATAMALLPFLAAGQTPFTNGPYRQTIRLGLDWLIEHQKRDGDLRNGGDMYTHGLAAITLCEAYGLTNDSRIRFAAEAAVRFIEASQIPSTGGWHYNPYPTPTPGDTSVVGWQLMALKSAQMAGLDVSPQAFEGARKWLDLVAKGKNKGLFSYNQRTPSTPPMSSVGLLCAQYLGSKRGDPAIQEGMAYLMTHLPDANSRNVYYWYYATQVMHNVPGRDWDTWNRQTRRLLIDTQIRQGCAAGSWDPYEPTPDAYAKQGGRIMTTSLCCLTLEVYYRYLPLYKLDAEEPREGESANQPAEASSK